MGKWNRRFTRSKFYRDYHWSPPREICRDPETVVWQDNVPMWEKKFCYLSGIAWEKVLGAKKFGHSNSPVLEWDDSAGEEAFCNSKERFWAKINGLPSQTQLPDPDMFIENVDWDPDIDHELVRDLERAYFNPDEAALTTISNSTKENSMSAPKLASEEQEKQDDGDNPWEQCLYLACQEHEATSWNQWDSCVNGMSELTNVHNPWECHDNKHDGDTWGKSSSWKNQVDSNPSTISNCGGGPWRHGRPEVYNNKPVNQNYSNGSSWKHDATNERNGPWGQRQWGERTVDRFSHGVMQGSCRKREGSEQYGPGYRGQRFNGGYDHQAGQHWRNVDNYKRVNFSNQ
ncbi:hypothetical protein AKJ16_DCAP20171 [Drosera capensis]